MKFLMLGLIFLMQPNLQASSKQISLEIHLHVDGVYVANPKIITLDNEAVSVSASSDTDNSGYSIDALPSINSDGSISIKLKVSTIDNQKLSLVGEGKITISNKDSASLSMSSTENDQNLEIKVRAEY